MAKFWRYIAELKTVSRLSFFFPQNIEQNTTAHRANIKILSCLEKPCAKEVVRTIVFKARSTRILVFLKPHTFLHELAASAKTKPVNLVTETPLFWKRFPEPSKHPSVRIRIKKCMVSKISGFVWTGPNFLLHLSRIAFVLRIWLSLTQLVGNPARLSSRKKLLLLAYWKFS